MAAFTLSGIALGLLSDAISVSLLIQRGSVPLPKTPLPWLVAIGGALGFVLIPLRLSVFDWPWAIMAGFLLMSLAASDLRAHVLPNSMLCLLATSLLLRAGLMGQLPQHLFAAIIALALLTVPTLLLSICLGKSAIGIGDIKLVMALGLLLGWPGVIGAITWGMLCGGVVTLTLLLTHKIKTGQPIAYGQFLVIGGWLFWMLGNSLPLLS